MPTYDLVVIGTGPGGYVCAIRAAQLGMKVAVVEKRATHGGTCLNVGCIPSKALLHASELFDEAGHTFETMGIGVGKPKLNLAAMMKFKDQGVDGNVKGVEFLLKKNKIDALHGAARIVAAGKVEVTGGAGTQTLETKAIVIATGSEVARLKGIEIDEKRVVSSDGGIALKQVPKRLLVVGAGVIGLELGSVWRRLGAQVTVVEFLDRILPGMDTELCKQFQRILQKQGMTFKLGAKVTGVDASGQKLKAAVEPAAGGGKAETIEADVVLVAIGRIPYTEGLGLDEAGVKRDERGRVIVDHHFLTNVQGIYAIGDVIAGPMLAHKAEDEGVAAAEIIAGKSGHVNYDVIPNVVYTSPEFASVGKTEDELKQAGVAYAVGKFPFTANGRAKVNLTTEGQVKIIADAKTDRVLGVHILGPDAGNMIAEAAIAMEFGASSEDIARTCHAHPTLTEAIKEAALAVRRRGATDYRCRLSMPMCGLCHRTGRAHVAARRRHHPASAWKTGSDAPAADRARQAAHELRIDRDGARRELDRRSP
jgi:dihydrolipoamide dehydrogenase